MSYTLGGRGGGGGECARYRFPGHALQVTNSRDLEKLI